MAVEQSRVTGAIGGAGQGAAAGAAFGPAGMVGGAIIGGIGGMLSGGGEDDAMKLAQTQADLARMTQEENLRQMRLESTRVLGMTKGMIGASNLQFTGSSKDYYNALESNMLSQQSFERLRGELTQQILKRGGQAAASSIKSAGIQSAFSGLSSAVGAGAFGSYTKAGGYKGPGG
jgi:hypothetical protein